MPGVLTYDGLLVEPDGIEAPSIGSLALAMSRVTRFVGMGQCWFSVLDHSMYILQLAEANRDLRAHEKLALLLHDAHEAITNDVPTHVKPNELRVIQKKLDTLIVREHFGDQQELWRGLSPLIKEFDQRALVAEAMVIGPPGFRVMPRSTFIAEMGSLPREEDMALLQNRIKMGVLSNPQMIQHNENAPNVKRFMWLVAQLQAAAETVLYPINSHLSKPAYGINNFAAIPTTQGRAVAPGEVAEVYPVTRVGEP